MLKKIITFLMITSIALSICACASRKPAGEYSFTPYTEPGFEKTPKRHLLRKGAIPPGAVSQ